MYEEFTGRKQNNSRKVMVLAALGVVAVVGVVVMCALPVEFRKSVSMIEVPESDKLAFETFTAWQSKFNKVYLGLEEQMFRFRVFKDNMAKIQALQEGRSYKLGLTKFADMTTQEFESIYLSNTFAEEESLGEVKYLETANIPDSIDWRERGVVQKVKNQGYCGSCWAFAAVAAVESLHAIQTGKLEDYSEQQLVDCSQDFGNMGCSGGFALWGQQYIAQDGVEGQSDYPYKAVDQKCKYDAGKVKYKTKGVTEVPKQDQSQLAAALANQPVAVRVKADSSVFQFYEEGVIDSTACGTQPNHAILAVGYNSVAAKPYFIVKNSWGADWGEQGYVRILKENKAGPGICGIAQGPTYPY